MTRGTGAQYSTTRCADPTASLLRLHPLQSHTLPLTREQGELTCFKCSSKAAATTPDMRTECSCANKVKLVITGLELKFNDCNVVRKKRRNELGSLATSGGGCSACGSWCTGGG